MKFTIHEFDWCCSVCGRDSHVEQSIGTPTDDVRRSIRAAHAEVSPGCPVPDSVVVTFTFDVRPWTEVTP